MSTSPVRWQTLKSRFLFSVLLGMAVIVGLALYGDLRALAAHLRGFRWAYVPLILGLTMINYALRFVKWEYYLRLLDIRGVSFPDSVAIFLSAFAMVLTPGKVGEVLKSYQLRRAYGVSMARSAPIVLAERLTDGVAMALLSSIGLSFYRQGWIVVAITLVLMVGLAAVAQVRPLALRLITWAERLPLVGRFAHELHHFYESAKILLEPVPLAVAVTLGTVSWAFEGVAFYIVLRGLGLPHTPQLVLQAIFILSFATIVGTLVMMPGGLGGVEGTITGLLQLLVGLDRSTAVTGTLLIRLGTLWFGVVLGLLSIFWKRHWLVEVPSAMPARSSDR
ncbi:MAG: lysylphosphatidylglycerol synthase transmembrane domain-containing protein [Ardenticatenia bacterium]|nr:lysylphosphatidylglycerol synthase transmembrane domain-containing protein [Ardenticatenia bacterium]